MASVIMLAGCLFVATMNVSAANTLNTIHSGVFIGDIDVSGMTTIEAEAAVNAYIDTLKSATITLNAQNDNSISATAEELGISWANPEVVEEAGELGTSGNIVQRYKALKDLDHENKIFDIQLEFDKSAISQIVTGESEDFNVPAVNAHLIRKDGEFSVEEGQTGIVVSVDESVDLVYNYLTTEWDGSNATCDLVVEVEEPQGTEEELLQVKDVLGTFTTSYSSSGSARSTNVANGCNLVNETTLYPGEEFSMYKTISPFSEENGYQLAGAYLNGMVVDSLGGGICQVSTTLYNAVLRSELEVTERHNHSMIVGYVDPSADAAISESAGKDFKFVNSTEHPIYIEGHTTSDKQITFTIYGVEYRDTGHKVEYESETIKTTQPVGEKIIADAAQPVGFVDVQSEHIGYVAKLWKIVYEDGKQVSKTEENNSSYNMSPRTATVGTATADPNALASINAAIATGSIDQCKAVAGALAGGDPNAVAAAVAAAQAAAIQAQQQAAADAAAAAQAAADAAAQDAAVQ